MRCLARFCRYSKIRFESENISINSRLPLSIFLATSTSPSRVNNWILPISRKYIRTGSSVELSTPGLRSSPLSSKSISGRESVLSSPTSVFFSESTTSISISEKISNIFSNCSGDGVSSPRFSLISSIVTNPFSRPSVTNSLTSFSSNGERTVSLLFALLI